MPALALTAALTGIVGCGGPLLMIPGGRLAGEERPAPSDFSALQDGVFELETRPDDPYSVQLNYRVRNGRLYIDPAEGRRWLAHIRKDPRVRARFGDVIHPLRATLVRDPAEREGFDPERLVYRLEARE